MKIQISTLDNTGDARGLAFTAPSHALDFVGRIADIHFASVSPGTVRGNHYHLHKRQALILFPGAAWSLHWDEGEGTPIQRNSYDGTRAVMVLISPAVHLRCATMERIPCGWRCVRLSLTIPTTLWREK